MTDTNAPAERLRYIAACISTHADKFPVPGHMEAHAQFLRGIARTTDEHPSAEDYRNRAERAEAECRELREALERIAAGRCGDANQFASNVASAALGEQP